MLITISANSRHFASAFILLVYARVESDAYTDFIIPHITMWSNSTTKPPRADGCTDKGGFYDSRGTKFNCMSYEANGCELGNNNTHAGLTANMACCACGGGDRKQAKSAKAKSGKNGKKI